MLPTLAPYPVDYMTTATYYWPNPVENATQIAETDDKNGIDTYEPTPGEGPFGFGSALKLDGTEVCISLPQKNIINFVALVIFIMSSSFIYGNRLFMINNLEVDLYIDLYIYIFF